MLSVVRHHRETANPSACACFSTDPLDRQSGQLPPKDDRGFCDDEWKAKKARSFSPVKTYAPASSLAVVGLNSGEEPWIMVT